MERIIIDMDEVIADPMGEMIEWYRKEHRGDVDWDKMLVGSWVKGFPEQHQSLVMDRIHSPGFFRNLPVMEDSIEVLREMNDR
jgi:5'-nucleotidase